MNELIEHPSSDGVDRRGFLKCMAWAGTGVLWTLSSGVLTSRVLGQVGTDLPASPVSGSNTLHFVQISDSHIGFSKPANPDVSGTFPDQRPARRPRIPDSHRGPDAPSGGR
jgi:hypothetical protein